jgi:hypothetical protein
MKKAVAFSKRLLSTEEGKGKLFIIEEGDTFQRRITLISCKVFCYLTLYAPCIILHYVYLTLYAPCIILQYVYLTLYAPCIILQYVYLTLYAPCIILQYVYLTLYEIGRASCRERVSKLVEFSGGGG